MTVAAILVTVTTIPAGVQVTADHVRLPQGGIAGTTTNVVILGKVTAASTEQVLEPFQLYYMARDSTFLSYINLVDGFMSMPVRTHMRPSSSVVIDDVSADNIVANV